MNRLEAISDLFCILMDDKEITTQDYERAKLSGLNDEDIHEIIELSKEIKEVIIVETDAESEEWTEEY
jgi:hypothetical protein